MLNNTIRKKIKIEAYLNTSGSKINSCKNTVNRGSFIAVYRES